MGANREARKREREIRTALEGGTYVRRGPESLGQFVEIWWPAKRASIAPLTAREYRRILDRIILPDLGKRPLQKITGGDVSSVISRIVERGALSLADHTFVFCRLMFNAALKQGMIGRSPMVGVERPRVHRREMTVLSPDEWQRVREHLEETESWALVPLSVKITTGLRREEICGLQRRDIDLELSLLHVRRVYQVIAGEAIYREPKTVRSRRAVALDAHTVALLRDHLAEADRIASMLGRKVRPTDPLFASADGTPFRPDTYTALWRRVREAVGVTVRLNDLRHSSATMLLAAGVPAHLVSSRLGHATAGFTLSTYAHALPGQQEAAAEALAAMLNPEPVGKPSPLPAGEKVLSNGR